MKAAQLIAPKRWEIIDVDKPAITSTQMLVRLERVGLCGSDKPSFLGVHQHYPLPPGATGHEGIGIVEASPCDAYHEGDRVLLWGFDRGLFQEYVLASVDGGCIPLPADGNPDTLLMSQLLGTVIHCFYKLGNLIGQNIVVLGQGPVGQLFNAALRNLGAGKIIAIDRHDHRLTLAHKMGATHTVSASNPDLPGVIAELTDGSMADMVIEAVGQQDTLDLCGSLLRQQGTLIYFGVPDKDHPEGIVRFNFLELFRKEIHVVTSVGPNPHQDYTIALDWILQERVDVAPIITHVEPLEQIQRGFELSYVRPTDESTVKFLLSF